MPQNWHAQDWSIVVEALEDHLHPWDPAWRQARIQELIEDIAQEQGCSATELIAHQSTSGRYLRGDY